ncbi:uncharacterized protein BJ171DRAFT_487369 [Polychytrium aggregatum]|uniref:uncharacterized protein n=1 Tax=Polychytrium aggregatum TaxID=110093 RepID=UPI0022FF3FED|nr:uncharacterized protein BJ171DRAFT_487369 [Polychytrium aggregatum]KAI9208804.1 hypothetical protein BJ171DRAFT_487369 [Polychytrium aggregatum]
MKLSIVALAATMLLASSALAGPHVRRQVDPSQDSSDSAQPSATPDVPVSATSQPVEPTEAASSTDVTTAVVWTSPEPLAPSTSAVASASFSAAPVLKPTSVVPVPPAPSQSASPTSGTSKSDGFSSHSHLSIAAAVGMAAIATAIMTACL